MPKITNRYKLQFWRRYSKKTDYKARLKSVRSGKIRAVVPKGLENFKVQFVKFEPAGDKTLAEADSASLKKFGWAAGSGNLPAAYLTGLLAGSLARAAKVETAILDIGLQPSTKGSRLYAAAKGILDSGIKMKVSENVFPAAERISGAHIAKWAGEVKNKNFFSAYKVQAKDLPKHFRSEERRVGKECRSRW